MFWHGSYAVMVIEGNYIRFVCKQNMHPKVKLDDGTVVTIIDLPARNGMLARVLGRVTRRYMIELFETGEKIVVERSQIRKNAMHHLNNLNNTHRETVG
jgi:hypothetical protein